MLSRYEYIVYYIIFLSASVRLVPSENSKCEKFEFVFLWLKGM